MSFNFCRPLTKHLLALALVATTIISPQSTPQAAEAPKIIHFGLTSTSSPEDVIQRWQPLLAALSKQLGIAIEPHVTKDYAGLVWAMREGTDSLAWLGNKSAIEAVDNAEGEVFNRMVFDNGEAEYFSLLIARTSFPHTSAPDVLAHAGELTLGSGDPNSTSGYLVPGYYLFARNGIDPRKAFRRVITANHETNILSVADGRIDIATVASNHFDQISRLHPEITANVREVWRSPGIASDPMVWRRDLPADMKNIVRNFFLDYGTPAPQKSESYLAEERRVLTGLGVSRFIASDNRQLIPTRQVELFRSRLALETNDKLSPDERQRRQDAIDSKLAELERMGTP